MITIDSRIGSRELLKHIPRDIPAQIGNLQFGDASFVGHGPNGNKPFLIGIERKTLTDLLNSMETGRLSGHQLIGLIQSYHVTYLVIEGHWRQNTENGALETPRRGGWVQVGYGKRIYSARELNSFLNTLMVITNLKVWETRKIKDTALLISHLYRWWQKDWDEHRGHLSLHKSRLRDGSGMGEYVDLGGSKPSLVRRVAAELEGVEWTLSKRIDERFGSVIEMMSATEEDWMEIEGIGKIKARRIVEEVHGE